MRGAEAAAGVAVKILVEQHKIAEMDVLLLDPRGAQHRPAAVLVAQKDSAQTAGKIVGHLAEMHQPPGAGRTLDLEIAPGRLQRFDRHFTTRRGRAALLQQGAGKLEDASSLVRLLGSTNIFNEALLSL